LPILDLKAQYDGLREEIAVAISGVLESQHFILGPNVSALEREIAAFCGTPSAIGAASGTDALILALRAAHVGPGDEVIVPAFSFIATADAVSILGARPVFSDVDPDTLNLNVAHAASLVTPRTKAIIPVHLYGQPADMDAVMALAMRHNLLVIEDCAQGLGARWRGTRVCAFGDYGCISFFPSKNLGAYGDGGMVTTSNEEDGRHIAALRSHGSTQKYHSDIQGMNSRLDELQAAILRVKLRKLEEWNEARRQVAAMYRAALAGQERIQLPYERPEATHVYHQFTVRIENRDAVQRQLAEACIQSIVYYPIPLHLQNMFQDLGYRQGDLPVAERASSEVLSLPMYPELTLSDIDYITAKLIEAVSLVAV